MRYKTLILLVALAPAFLSRTSAQAFETEQLLLDIQKLAQEKQLLDDLYKGYEIIDKGYGAIRDISKGSFSLHKTFLDGLLTVSPAVKQYRRVADIIDLQVRLVSSYSSAWARFKKDPRLRPDEILLLGRLYSGLFDESINILNSLTTLLTDGQLRADDGQRIRRIDGLYEGMQSKWVFLRSVNNRTEWLSLQRSAVAGENTRLKRLYGLTF
jgi:hypothetical protein